MSRRKRPTDDTPALPPTPDRPALPAPEWDRPDRVPWCWSCRRSWLPKRLDAGACPNCGDEIAAREI